MDNSLSLDTQESPSNSQKIHALQKMIAQGLNEETVTLTFIPGIGAKTANKLRENNIVDIEDLAVSDHNYLASFGGISKKRAQKWIQYANENLKTFSALYFRETRINSQNNVNVNWPNNIDPYRLRRALDLHVIGADANVYRVSGGLEPHTVYMKKNNPTCDCMDFQKGFLCKHILAVRLQQKEEKILELVRLLKQESQTESVNLFDLWFSQ